MTAAIPKPLTLEQFLAMPDIEASPAWELICQDIIQKPMPGGKHSRLQLRLEGKLDAADSDYEALPELRCTFGGQSIVPDLVVLKTNTIPTDEAGDIISTGIDFAPPWIIEILSPEQNQTRLTRKILHCLRHGTHLGWLIDPYERVVLAYQPNQLPDELVDDAQLPGLPNMALNLTAARLFSWLKVGTR